MIKEFKDKNRKVKIEEEKIMDDNKDIQDAYDAKMDTRAFSRVYKRQLQSSKLRYGPNTFKISAIKEIYQAFIGAQQAEKIKSKVDLTMCL